MRVLLVEDDQNKLRQISQFLSAEFEGIEIVEGRSFQAGLREAVAGNFDVLLLDMTMPTYDRSPTEPGGKPRPFAGRELLRQLQSRGISLPTIVITQFEKFGEEGKEISLQQLKEELAEDHGDSYKDTVYYSPTQTKWRGDLKGMLVRLGLKVKRRA